MITRNSKRMREYTGIEENQDAGSDTGTYCFIFILINRILIKAVLKALLDIDYH